MTGAGADRGSTGYINYANVTKFSRVSSNIIHHQNISACEEIIMLKVLSKELQCQLVQYCY